MTWSPVLDHELATAARRAVIDIAANLGDVAAEDAALFLAYAASAFDETDIAASYDLATQWLPAALSREAPWWLHGGTVGVAWTIAHIIEGGGDDLLSEIDRQLQASVSAAGRLACDLSTGLAGLGAYFLERQSASADGALASQGLAIVTARLDEQAVRTADGVAWHTPVEMLGMSERTRWPKGYISCSPAHGVPGIVVVLGRIARSHDPHGRAEALCRDGLRWMSARYRTVTQRARFPRLVANGQPIGHPDDGWCAGDLGVAITCWRAAECIGEPTELWRDVAREAAARAEVETRDEPGLCHGAIGLAHIFNRCFQATGEPTFRDAARTWFARGLAMRTPGGTDGGFAVPHLDEARAAGGADLLLGPVGVALGLLAAISDEEPGWDRKLACDLGGP